MYSGNLLWVKTFLNFAVSRQFTKVLTTKIFIEYGGIIIIGDVIILDNGDSIGIMDVASQNPLACKAVLIQQQFLKPLRRHGDLDQQSQLRTSLAYSSSSCQFNFICCFLPMHYSCFPQFVQVLVVKFDFQRFVKVSRTKDSRYTVPYCQNIWVRKSGSITRVNYTGLWGLLYVNCIYSI